MFTFKTKNFLPKNSRYMISVPPGIGMNQVTGEEPEVDGTIVSW